MFTVVVATAAFLSPTFAAPLIRLGTGQYLFIYLFMPRGGLEKLSEAFQKRSDP